MQACLPGTRAYWSFRTTNSPQIGLSRPRVNGSDYAAYCARLLLGDRYCMISCPSPTRLRLCILFSMCRCVQRNMSISNCLATTATSTFRVRCFRWALLLLHHYY